MSEVVVFDNPKWRPSKRLLLTVIGGVVVVVAVITYAIIWHQHSQKTKNYNAVTKLASNDSLSGNFNQALMEYESAVKYASTKDQKEKVYSGAVQSAINSGDTNTAQHYYNLESQLDPAFAGQDAFAMATVYQLNGQKQQSIAQYKVSIRYLQGLLSKTSKSQLRAYYNAEISSEQSLLTQEKGQQ